MQLPAFVKFTGLGIIGVLLTVVCTGFVIGVVVCTWAALVFFGSLLIHAGFPSVPEATWLQSLGIGFGLMVLSAVI